MLADVFPGVVPGREPQGPLFFTRKAKFMTNQGKPPEKTEAKCKTARRRARAKSPPLGKASPGKASPFSRAWMGAFLGRAERDGDVKAALEKADVSLVEYRCARRSDPVFDAACADVDLAVRQSIRENLELEAASGGKGAVRAAALLAKGLGALELIDETFGAKMPSHVAAAMIQAGLVALRLETPDPALMWPSFECPHCKTRVRPNYQGGVHA